MWGSCINLVLMENDRIWSIGVKIPVFGFEPRKESGLRARAAWRATLPARGTVPENVFFIRLSFGVFLIGIL